MLDTELESKIRKCIEKTYNCKCTSKIKAQEIVDDPEGPNPRRTFVVYLYVHDQMKDPVHIIWEGDTEDNFFKFLKADLKQRDMIRSSIINIVLEKDDI